MRYGLTLLGGFQMSVMSLEEQNAQLLKNVNNRDRIIDELQHHLTSTRNMLTEAHEAIDRMVDAVWSNNVKIGITAFAAGCIFADVTWILAKFF